MFCGFQNLYPDFFRVGVVLPAWIGNTEDMNNTETITYRNDRYIRKGEYRTLTLCYKAPSCGRNPGNNDGFWIAVDEDGDVLFGEATRASLINRIDYALDQYTDEARDLIHHMLGLN